MVSQVESLENRARIECLADQFLFLWIEQVRDQFAMVTHNRGPKIDDLPITHAGITAGDLFQTARRAPCFTNGVIEEKRKDKCADLSGILRFQHPLFVLDERFDQFDGRPIEGRVVITI